MECEEKQYSVRSLRNSQKPYSEYSEGVDMLNIMLCMCMHPCTYDLLHNSLWIRNATYTHTYIHKAIQ